MGRSHEDKPVMINEGIRIERIVAGLQARGIRLDKQSDRETGTARAFLSVHDRDLHFVEELEKHLAPLKAAGKLAVWHQGKGLPGSSQSQDIARELRAADLVLLIVSPDYLASDKHLEEARIAMDLSKSEDVRVVPILVRPASWELTPFGKLAPLPQDRRPVVLQPNADQAYVDIAKAIGAVLSDNDF